MFHTVSSGSERYQHVPISRMQCREPYFFRVSQRQYIAVSMAQEKKGNVRDDGLNINPQDLVFVRLNQASQTFEDENFLYPFRPFNESPSHQS